MSKIISTGSTFRFYGDDLVTHNQLPAQIYSIRCSKMTGFYLEKHADIEINEDKIYGVHMEKVNKVLNAFPNFNKNLGVILSGAKGIGKSLFSKILAVEAVKKGLPVIIVDTYIPGIANFIEEIEQEVLVMFDEFDKTFGGVNKSDGMADPQTELLTLFDGLAQGKKLYVITCNNLNTLSDYLVNRPGRFHYHFRFDYPTDSEITEYMRDKLHEEYYSEINKVIAFSKRVNLNYDCLRAIAFELNTGLQFQEAIKDMNILHINNTVYIATLYTKDGKKDIEEKSLDLFDKTANHSLYFTIDGKWFYAKFSGVDVRYDFDRHIDFIDGKDIEIVSDDDDDYGDLTEEEKEKYENIKIDHIVFAKKEAKGLHYNLTV